MKLKICGITNKEDLDLCTKYADAVGFIVGYPKSPRNIPIEKAKKLMKYVPPFVTTVIVIPDFKKAEEIYSKLKPGIVQLHGQETVEAIKRFSEKVSCKIIKACKTEDALKFSEYADAILIDEKYPKIDLAEVNKLLQRVEKPIILAGNLTPENILNVLEKVEPYGIDVASGVEYRPGKKDPEKVKRLKKKLELGKTVGGIIKNKPIAPSFEFYKKLRSGNDLKLIAELKPASPSEGKLREVSNDLGKVVKAMEQGRASALSVLVEKEGFSGGIGLLKNVRNLTSLPILAKGIFFEPRQIAEVAVAGASAFLLMVRVVDAEGKSVKELIDFGRSLKIDAVVEASSGEELVSAINSGARIIEINNRSIYSDLSIDPENTKLGRSLPKNVILISASGINSPDDISKLFELSKKRVDAFLVGTSVMRSKDIRAKVQELTKACEEVAYS